VPCLALSQKPGITEIGDFIFRNTLTPEMQMRRCRSGDVAGGLRIRDYFPNDSYGTEFATAFWDHVLIRGGQITTSRNQVS